MQKVYERKEKEETRRVLIDYDGVLKEIGERPSLKTKVLFLILDIASACDLPPLNKLLAHISDLGRKSEYSIPESSLELIRRVKREGFETYIVTSNPNIEKIERELKDRGAEIKVIYAPPISKLLLSNGADIILDDGCVIAIANIAFSKLGKGRNVVSVYNGHNHLIKYLRNNGWIKREQLHSIFGSELLRP
ncbi:MAG: hypothetical protein QXL16_02650 [Candidatus Micrarchaeaceae archaeon]